MAEASYPADLLYHSEHDWARIDADDPTQATLGITWFAQDALGEVVFFDPPGVGTALAKDSPYAEVESVKAVSDVVAPLSGEIVAPSCGGSKWTSSPSASCANHVIPSTASSPSMRAQSCSLWYFRSSG